MKFKIFRFKKVKSTNNTAIRIIKKNNQDYGMVIAETQSSGKGQYGRKWISYKGNLFVSFFYNLQNFSFSMTQLTKINCLLVKKLISNHCKKKIIFKKPNDLLIDKKKISGILQEIVNKSYKRYMIVGIGVNLIKNPNIKGYATSKLSDYVKKTISKKNIELELKKIFENNLKKFNKVKKKR